MQPNLSIIIPCYNDGDIISRAIQSILKQTYQNFEITVVNDGSTDQTEKIVRKFQDMDGRIKYLKHEINRGLSATRNTGIKNAKGDYIAFLDADDEWLPNKLQKQLELFQNSNNKKLGFVSTGTIFVRGKNRKSYWLPPKRGYIFTELLKGNIILGGGSSCLIKKVVFDECGLFDESDQMYSQQDYEMWLRIAQKYEFNIVEEYLTKCYDSKGINYNVVYIDPAKGVASSLYILKKYKNIFKKHPNAYSSKLKFLGIQYILARLAKKARRCLLESIKFNPRDYFSYFYLLISFGGSFGSALMLKIHELNKFYLFNYKYI
ncbi:MAG: glycosyltransferase family 2 protein [Candidatus Hodarchaeota archaeon]